MTEQNKRSWLEQPIHPSIPALTGEMLVFIVLLLLGVATRFYNLGARVMSHDESLHTYFSWLLYKGNGYQHTPMMHGPWQFHMIALSYFLFGPSDFTARIPAALFSLATIGMVWYWRRYLGKTGALVAGLLMIISPMMLFYGRYVREDSYAVFSGVLMLYAVLRYLESGARKYLYWFVIALILHFLDKETSFIYAAQLLIFLAVYFVVQITRQPWRDERFFRGFIIALAAGVLFAGLGGGIFLSERHTATLGSTEVAAPANPSATASPLEPVAASPSPALVLIVIGLVAIIVAGYFLFQGYTWQRIKQERSFDLLIVIWTLVLPLLVAFPIKFSEGWLHVKIPTTAPEIQSLVSHEILVIGIFLAALYLISIAIGQLWDKEWWKLALTFWIPFTVFFTTIFTNSDGFFTGVIGSLGYWLVQQGVQRGSQPWYFYVLIQIPVYEFLPLLGAGLALILGLRRRGASNKKPASGEVDDAATIEERNFPNMFALLLWWTVASIVALSYAGEKMPWLTIHLTWPMILLSGWGIGQLIDTTDWKELREKRALLVLAVLFIFFTSVSACLLSLLGSNPPFQGKELNQLQATSAFLLPAIAAIASAVALIYLLRPLSGAQTTRAFSLTFFFLMAVLTVRAAFRAAYINYDNATEYLVYAHAATGVKDIINQAAEISKRTTGGMGINIAYDASSPDTGVSWPFVWYLRDFTNQHSFDQPTRSLRDSVVVVVDQKNFDKIEPALGPGYYRVDYIRMWWPNQDYFGLVNPRDPSLPFDENYSCKGPLGFFRLFKSKDYSRICSAILDPRIRAGIINIWLNRDYTSYAEATNHTDLTLATWQPSDEMRMYIRKDVARQMWKYGVAPAAQAAEVDPYKGKVISLPADKIVDSSTLPSSLNAPRALAVAPDGSIYVADSRNNRILHLDPEGAFIGQFGSSSGGDPNNPPPSPAPGTFNEPWGVAVGPTGDVYVTDTWNHRIQKFTADGQFLKSWGVFGQGETPDSFYGPRGLAVDAQGRVYVVDTGNKRIVVFDAEGNFLTQFGSQGLDPGQFDEPVGIAIDAAGTVYVADTWNQRIQSFTLAADGLTFTPLQQWDVVGWNGQSLDNKPFISVDNRGHVFITDPDGFRVIEYTTDGQLVQTWGDYGTDAATFTLTSGIGVDTQGRIWVSDTGNNRLMRFTLP